MVRTLYRMERLKRHELTMRLSIEIDQPTIEAIARVLEADATEDGFTEADGDMRDEVLTRLVAQAWCLHNISTPPIPQVVERDYQNFGRARRSKKMPRSRHTAPR